MCDSRPADLDLIDFDRFGLDCDRFRAISMASMDPLEKTIIDEKAIENEELLDVHFFPKWHFIGALMARHRAEDGIY